MEESMIDRLTPAEEDPEVHGHLAALARHEPRGNFPDRVFVNVWQPAPRRIRDLRLTIREWVDSGRVWFLIGAFAAGSLIPIAVGVVAIATWRGELASALGQAGPGMWSAIVTGWNGTLAEVGSYWAANAPTGETLALVGSAAAVTTVICTVGLHRMVRLGRTAKL